MYAKFVKTVLIVTTTLLLMSILVVVVCDPFAQYHTPWLGLQPLLNRGTQSYANPGMAKSYPYDSLLIGSSVAENFYASQFDEAFDCKTLKLPYAGGSATNYSTIMDVAFRHRVLKNVFHSLDMFAVINDPSLPKYTLPDYLYDDNIWNDTDYVLNKDVFDYLYKMIDANQKGEIPDLDSAYNWESEYSFSKKRVLKFYDRPRVSSKTTDIDKYIENIDASLDTITAYIEQHPKTRFVIFFPPYSILWFDNLIRKGLLDAMTTGMEHTMARLLTYDNVELYSFAGCEDVITNLDNYRESMHFSEKINAYMVDCMKEGKYRITKRNYRDEMTRLEDFVSNYDYDAIFE